MRSFIARKFCIAYKPALFKLRIKALFIKYNNETTYNNGTERFSATTIKWLVMTAHQQWQLQVFYSWHKMSSKHYRRFCVTLQVPVSGYTMLYIEIQRWFYRRLVVRFNTYVLCRWGHDSKMAALCTAKRREMKKNVKYKVGKRIFIFRYSVRGPVKCAHLTEHT